MGRIKTAKSVKIMIKVKFIGPFSNIPGQKLLMKTWKIVLKCL